MSSNCANYDFIYPSAANPSMGGRNKNTQPQKQTSQAQNPKNSKPAENKKRPNTEMNNSSDSGQPNNGQGRSPDIHTAPKKSKTDKENCECKSCDKMNSALGGIAEQLANLTKQNSKLDDIQKSINDLQSGLQGNRDTVQQLQVDVEEISHGLTAIQTQLDDFRSEKVKLEVEVKRINLIVAGIEDETDETDEDLKNKIQTMAKEIKQDINFDCDTIRRLGEYKPGKTRRVHIRFKLMSDRNAFFELKKSTKHPIYINADVPEAVQKAEFKMREKIRNLKANKINIINVNYRNYEIETDIAIFRLENLDDFSEMQKNEQNDQNLSFLESRERE